MPIKKRTTKKRTTKTKKSSGIGSYVRKLNNAPAVKRAAKTIKALEQKLTAAKRKKAAAVKVVRKKLSKSK